MKGLCMLAEEQTQVILTNPSDEEHTQISLLKFRRGHKLNKT